MCVAEADAGDGRTGSCLVPRRRGDRTNRRGVDHAARWRGGAWPPARGRSRRECQRSAFFPDSEPFLKTLRDGLHDRGYSEGRKHLLETRTAEGQLGLLAEEGCGTDSSRGRHHRRVPESGCHGGEASDVVMASAARPSDRLSASPLAVQRKIKRRRLR
jgi:hypothetical protein